MTDKHRQVRALAPRGALSNWVLAAFMASFTAIALAWRALV